VPPPHAAHPPGASILHCDRDALHAAVYDYAKKAYKLNSRQPAGKVYPHEIGIQKTHLKHRKLDSQAALPHPTRDRPADGLRRYGHRDATMILVAYRHGLRASEVCDLQWQQIELSEGRLHVHRVKNGIPSVHPIRGDEMRALRKLRRDYPRDAHVFVSERGGPISPIGFHRLVQRLGEVAKMPFPIHPHMLRHACGFKLANDGHDTRALQHYLGHKNIQHTVRYTEMAPDRFKDFWRD
jgi:integrase